MMPVFNLEQEQFGTPTIVPYQQFNPEEDCEILRKAMKGFRHDQKALIDVLANRSCQQRQQLRMTFKTMYGKDLLNDLKSELHFNFERTIVQLLESPIECDVIDLREAMKGVGTDEHCLTEIIVTRSGNRILEIREAYKRIFDRDLETDVHSETSGHYRRLLVSCLQGNRGNLSAEQLELLGQNGPSAIVDMDLAQTEANELYQAGEKLFGTDESCFIRIMCTRNSFQLQATFEEYKQLAGRDIIESIESEMHGDIAASLKAIAMTQTNRPRYFAERLHKSMQGLGTDDKTLIRIVVTRSEIDLGDIKKEFLELYGKTLEDWIVDDTSGDYKHLLLKIVEGNYEES